MGFSPNEVTARNAARGEAICIASPEYSTRGFRRLRHAALLALAGGRSAALASLRMARVSSARFPRQTSSVARRSQHFGFGRKAAVLPRRQRDRDVARFIAHMLETDVGRSCATCGQAVTGRYCASCGEEVLDPRKLTVRHFITHSLVPELVNLDGRAWRTLRYLLFRPGYLALEYAAGRRRAYVRPFRVLLVAIIVYAFATRSGLTLTLFFGPITLSLAPASIPERRSLDGTLDQIDRFGVLERVFTAKLGPVTEATEEVGQRFNDLLGNFATPVSFATVFLMALVLFLVFRRRRPLFVEHAVFSMHCFSLVLLSSLVSVAVIELDLLDNVLAGAALILGVTFWQAAYIATALRRFYWHLDRRRLAPWTQAAAVAILLFLLNGVFLTGIQLLGGAYAIWRL
jgi:hypothetical protein